MTVKKNESLGLQVECLESRMMLSSVAVNAAGDTGDEVIELQIKGETVEVFELSTVTQQFVYESDQPVQASDVRVQFVNDLYLPEEGVDRNVRVDSIEIDGAEFRTDASNVFASGVWDNDSGAIVDGLGLGSSLQANGFFQYGLAVEVEQIDFSGRTWDVVEGSATTEVLSVDPSGALTISGANGPLAISTRIDVEPGTFYDFSSFAFRSVEAGGFSSDSQPWATFGVDFYGDSGAQLGQSQFEVNTESGRDIFAELTPPAGTTSAYAWYWVDGFQADVNIPLQVEFFNVQAVEPVDDFVRPEAALVPTTLTNSNETIFNFAVDITDNLRIGQVPADSLTITGPGGFIADSILATGLPGNNDTFRRLIFFFQAPNGVFTPADNGIYQVALKPNKISDFAGNFAAETVLGNLEIAIGSANT